MKQQPLRCAYLEQQITLDHLEQPRPCCQFSKTISIDNYQKDAQKYVDRLYNGEQISECSMCWNLENKGIRSLRQQYNHSEEINETEKPSNNIMLTKLDIRINNKCNLACTMCGNWASSLWEKIISNGNEKNIDSKSLDFVKTIEKDLRRISLQGGEPFFGNEYKEFLDSLQYKNQIQVEVFTNLITANENDLVKWDNEFDKFILNVSVDGIYERYTDIRWPTTWKKFNKKSIQILPKLKNVRFFYTVQNITIEYISDFISWRNHTVPDAAIIFPILQFPFPLSIAYSSQSQLDKSISDIENLIANGEEKIENLSQILIALKQVKVNEKFVTKQMKFLDNIEKQRSNYIKKSM